jgi:DNA-binding response OmpR family regulator
MKPKILVIDDDRPVLESLTKLLEGEHYEVYPARDAMEAIDCFNARRIDLVVLDINLGADNGWKVFETMTATNPFVPTIVITAEWGQRERAVTLGVEGLIEKPIDVPVFLKMVRELLAETTEAKLKRICGNDAYCRYVGRHYEPYLRMLQERYTAPLRMASRSEVPTGGDLDVDTEWPAVIPASADIDGWRAESDRARTSSVPLQQAHSILEDDPIARDE